MWTTDATIEPETSTTSTTRQSSERRARVRKTRRAVVAEADGGQALSAVDALPPPLRLVDVQPPRLVSRGRLRRAVRRQHRV